MKIKHIFCIALLLTIVYFMTGDCKKADAATEEPFQFSDETKDNYQGQQTICIGKDTTFHIQDNITYADVKKITFTDDVDTLVPGMFLQFPNTEAVELPKNLKDLHGCFGSRYTDIYHHDQILSLTKLQSISISEENPDFTVKDNVLYNKDMTVMVYYPAGKMDQVYRLPETVTQLKADPAFRNDHFEKIEISPKMEANAVSQLTTAWLPNVKEYVTRDDCKVAAEDGIVFSKDKTKLILYPQGKKVDRYVMPATVTELGEHCFYNTTIKTLVLSPNACYIPYDLMDPSYDYYDSPTVNFETPFDNSHIEAFELSDNEECSTVDGVIYNKDQTRLIYWPSDKKVSTLKFPCTLKYLTIDGNIPCISQVTSFIVPRDMENLSLKDEMPMLSKVQVEKGCKGYGVFSGGLYSSTYDTLYLVPAQLKQSSLTIPKNFKRIGYPHETLVPSVTSITVNGAAQAFPYQNFPNLSKLTLAKNYKGAKVVKNVLYSANMKELLWYPQAKKDAKFTMPASVTTMNRFTLETQKYIQSITLSKNLKIAQPTATLWFADCNKLKEIKIASGSKTLASKDGVLYTKDMKTLICYPAAKTAKTYNVPNSTKVFFLKTGNPNLQSITLPANLRKFVVNQPKHDHFATCPNLTQITVDAQNKNFYSKDGILYKYNNDQTIELYAYPLAKPDETFTIPANVSSITCTGSFQQNHFLKSISTLSPQFYTFGLEVHDIDEDFHLR